MAPDDRDRNFENALARHLRSSSSTGAGAAAASAPSCPDPEILAAYHEQSLSALELASWKEHVLGCIRCQSILAELSATDHLILEPTALQDPLLAAQPVSSPKDHSGASRSSRVERHSPSWRWILLIPAGAVAAVLVAYISLREQPPRPLKPTSSVEVAENRTAPAPESASKPALVEPGLRDEKDRSAASGMPAPYSRANIPSEKTQANERKGDNAKVADQTPIQTGSGMGSGPSISLQKQQQDQQLAASAGRVSANSPREAGKKLDQNEPAVVPKFDARGVPAQPPPPPAPIQEQPSFVAGGSISAGARQNPAPAAPSAANSAKEKAQSADAISSVTESVEVSAEPRAGAGASADSRARLRAAALANPHVFAAPDGKHLWRLGPAGMLEHSSDRGVKWTPQATGVAADLQFASAPSANVCWIVGSASTILRTTDNGAHWSKINPPASTGEFAGIRAADAMHADVWFTPDPRTGFAPAFKTEDGGTTWLAIQNQ